MCDCSELFDELAELWIELKDPRNNQKMRDEIMNDIDSVEDDLAYFDCGA